MTRAADQDEWLDVLDPQGRPTGVKPRRLVHRDHDWHGLVFVWSAWADRQGQRMVLQQRGRPGDPFAQQVDALAGGHLAAGETPVDAARRELAEEVGVRAAAGDLVRLGALPVELPIGSCRRVVQHLLLYPVPLDLADLRVSDEAGDFVEVDLEAFAGLVGGRCAAAPARQRRGRGVDEVRLERRSVEGYPAPVLDTFGRSLAAIATYLREGRVDPDRLRP